MRKSISLLLVLLIPVVLSVPVAGQVKTSAKDTKASEHRSQSASGAEESRVARHFDSIRKSPPELLAFFLRMPKGGDLHNHLSGSIYAESYIKWSAEKGLCVNPVSFTVFAPPCDETADQVPIANALTNSLLYRQIIDAWSMRYWQYSGKNGHDQFFDTFGKFSVATYDQTGRMVADAAARAARGQVLYLELMLTPDGGLAGQLGQKVGWDGSAEGTLKKLQAANINDVVKAAVKNLETAEQQKNEILKCGQSEADPGCAVTIRYVAQVSRGSALGTVFAQMATGFMLASDPTSRVVGVNLVQPEDGFSSMENFSTQMNMLRFLRQQFPKAHLTLHAGEFGPGVVPPAGLSFHIRDSVNIAGAERIGHGVDIMHETDAEALLKEMARQNIMVEICLSSNDLILGVSGANHPLSVYMKYGVPVALATDDEGISRSEISGEFLRAALDQGLDYSQLKHMARTSLTYSFISGASLWAEVGRPVRECSGDTPGGQSPSTACGSFLANNEKARLQWKLEEQFKKFEAGF